MYLLKPSHEILTPINPVALLKRIEAAGRTCYKSENRITEGSARIFVKSILERHHESVIEHESISVRFICDRGVTHELVRHRIASYSQESTRYVNYGKKGVSFIIPPWVNAIAGQYTIKPTELDNVIDGSGSWINSMLEAEKSYKDLLALGWKPEQARTVLPNSLKTEIVVTMNLRSWRHFFKLRCASSAHPQIREIAKPLLVELQGLLPEIFQLTTSPQASIELSAVKVVETVD